MTKILVVSSNALLPCQIASLRNLFGQDVAIDTRNIPNAADAVAAFKAGGYKQWIFIGPLATHQVVLRECFQSKCQLPARPKMRPAQRNENPDVRLAHGDFVFLGWEMVSMIELVLEEPGQLSGSRVLLVTQRQPSESARSALQRLSGNCSVAWLSSERPPRHITADWVISEAARLRADEVVLVAPLTVYADLARLDRYPLWAEMTERVRGVDGRLSKPKFVKWWRVKGLSLVVRDCWTKSL